MCLCRNGNKNPDTRQNIDFFNNFIFKNFGTISLDSHRLPGSSVCARRVQDFFPRVQLGGRSFGSCRKVPSKRFLPQSGNE
jgi:hypothetical protein